MDFELTDEQRELRAAGRRLLATSSPITRVRQLADSGDGFDRDVWHRAADLGWPALAVPAESGGLGQHLVDLAVVALDHGRALYPSPFLPTVVVADALVTAGSHAGLVRQLADGTRTAAWAGVEAGDPWCQRVPAMSATVDGGGYRLDGAKVLVQDASSADVLLVEAHVDSDAARFVVPCSTRGIDVRRVVALDVTRELDDVTFTSVRVGADALVVRGPDADRSRARSAAWMTVLLCAELVGVGERLLELSVEYAGVREQFGRPIGSFQALKHKCATMRIQAQASSAATYYAAMALDAGTADADRAVSVAKSYVSAAIVDLAGEALQLHGGIGFTWEHDLHLYLRRAKSNALLFGDVAFHRERLCRLLGEQAQSSSTSSP